MQEYFLEDYQKDILEDTEEGKAFLEYHKKFGTAPFPLSRNTPDFTNDFKDLTALYNYCIENDITWQEFYNYDDEEQDGFGTMI